MFGRRRYRQRFADEVFDVAHVALLVGRRERDSATGKASASRATNAVHIVLGVVGQVEVEHKRNPLHVNAARGDIGGDEHAILPLLESVERLLAAAKRKIRVEFGRRMAHLFDGLGDLLRAVFRARENKHRPRVLGEHLLQELRLVHLVHENDFLRYVFRSRALWRDFDANRQAHVLGGDVNNGRWHRCREQHRLTIHGNRFENALDLRRKTHVEHTVSFVEHEDGDIIEFDGALFEVVDKASRRRDNNVRLFSDRLFLVVHRRTADKHRRTHANTDSDRAQAFINLQRQLARR